MAITVDWPTRVINVPRADMPIVQVSPEIRELDLDLFRLTLKDLEDGEDGIVFPDTHSHNQPVTVGGVTLARVVEIINGYTVEFEDGQYAVNLFGANSNVGDVTVVNQVSIRSANSAGLIDNTNGGLTVEQDNLLREIHGQISRAVYIDTEAGTNGNGFQQTPFNNWTDGVDYAEANGLRRLVLLADAVVDRQLRNFIIEGVGVPEIDLNGQDMKGTFIERCRITGSYLENIQATECIIVNLSNVAGTFLTCAIGGTVTVRPNASLLVSRVAPAVAGQPWVLDMNSGVGSVCSVHNATGVVHVVNMDHVDDALDFYAAQGEIIIGASNVLGIAVLGGDIRVDDALNGGTTIDKSRISSQVLLKTNAPS